jgi:hypothetical protein
MPGPNAFTVNGNVGLLSSRQMTGSLGAYYTASNPTTGTAIAFINAAAFSATANGLILVQNTGVKTIYWDRLTLIQTATAPTATFMRFEVFNETGLVTGTGNVATVTPVQCNTGGSQATGAVVQAFNAGAITIPAAASGATRRRQGLTSVVCGVPVVQDVTVIDFGTDGTSPGTAGLTAAGATAPKRSTGQMAPILVAPNTTSWINLWGPATNVPSYEFEFAFIEI